MKTFKICSANAGQTVQAGKKLARQLKGGDILCLFGDLGTGKTTLIKGIAQGLGILPSKVRSPTFVLMNAYGGKIPLYHFDLYRLEEVQEISTIGYEEFLYDDGVAVIEWADRLKELTPEEYLRVELKHKGENERLLKFAAVGEKYCRIIKGMVNGKW